jgi:predicted DNA-binding antitoxin AbrB/MazE fold protein
MEHVEAIYQGGVFKPEGEVHLAENQRVRLSIEPVAPVQMLAWLARAQELRRKIHERRGEFLPDSTMDIAEDRMRDV